MKHVSILVLGLFFSCNCSALSIGSDTTFSRQPYVTFPAIDPNNTLLGFASFEGGFRLQDQSTTATYDDFFPVSGGLFLNGGTLTLLQDFVTSNTFNMNTGGVIDGKLHSFEIAQQPSDVLFPSQIAPANARFLFNDVAMIFNNNTILTKPITFNGTCRLNCRGYTLKIAGGASISIRPGARLIIEDTTISGFQNGNVVCQSDASQLTLRRDSLVLDNNFTFTQGALYFDQDVVMTGTGNFIFAAGVPSVINTGSILLFDRNITFSYAPRVALGNLLQMVDVTSYLHLNGCNLFTTRTGLQLSTGTLFFDNRVTVSSEAKNSAEALTLKSSLDVEVLGGATVDLFGIIKYDV